MKLNGWQRLGLVLSALWLAVIAVIGFHSVSDSGSVDSEAWYALPSSAFGISVAGYNNLLRPEQCSTVHHKRPDLVPNVSDCVRGVEQTAYGEPSFGAKGLLLFGLLPVFCAWLAVYLSLFAWRWIAAGFKGSTGTNGEG